jgi:putative flippase GtrA/glycosyltransferase involved in cell wall biosynthesis
MLNSVSASQLDVAVLIPCYNEAATVGKVVADFRSALPQARIYVYDNNSTDQTIQQATLAGAIVRLETRQGKGNVVKRMFADIEADLYVLVDGDDTYPASYAPQLIQCLLTSQVDMLNVARQPIDTRVYRPGHQFGNRMLNGLVDLFFENPFTDMLSGYRVLTHRFVKSFPILASGFEIETELTVHAIELQMPVQEVALPFKDRPSGSVSKLNTIRDGFKILRLIIRLLREDRPLQFFSLSSLLMLGISLVFMVPIIQEYLVTGLVPRLPTVVVLTGLALLACLSFAVGLILDTVTRGRRELKKLHYLSLLPPWDNDQSGLSGSIPHLEIVDRSQKQSIATQTLMAQLFSPQFLQFAIVGGLGFGVDTLSFMALKQWTPLHLYAARALAFPLAVTATWFFNRHLTFRERPRNRRKRVEYGLYFLVSLCGLGANFGTFVGSIELFPSLKTVWIVPLGLGTLAGLWFNYNLSRSVVFQSDRNKQS